MGRGGGWYGLFRILTKDNASLPFISPPSKWPEPAHTWHLPAWLQTATPKSLYGKKPCDCAKTRRALGYSESAPLKAPFLPQGCSLNHHSLFSILWMYTADWLLDCAKVLLCLCFVFLLSCCYFNELRPHSQPNARL